MTHLHMSLGIACASDAIACLRSSMVSGLFWYTLSLRYPMSKHGIIGPYWFKNDDGHAVTINSARYVEVLHKFWAELGQQRRFFRARQWFQQDGATPHTSDESLTWLQQRFGGRLISRRCDPEWSAYSPDLNPLDFFLLGYLKDRV